MTATSTATVAEVSAAVDGLRVQIAELGDRTVRLITALQDLENAVLITKEEARAIRRRGYEEGLAASPAARLAAQQAATPTPARLALVTSDGAR